ncbi:MAG TPA: DUF4304 domain-containing protein [Steroidobacteraceae bacterium]|jgi:hypothetical protein
MVKRDQQFGETVLEIAHQKLRAAKARFERVPVVGQAPRDVYKAFCQAIADALAGDGFEYARSRASLTRKSSDLGSSISFQSSHYNVAGELVVLIIHAGVTSQRLKSWRATHPSLMGGHDIVAGGQIGNLRKPESWIRWNLASEEERDEEIADAVAAIHELAYPYFELFKDIAAVRARLVAEDIPSMGLASALDFMMCFGSGDEVLAFAARVFRENVQVQERYHAALVQYQSEGVPRHVSGPYGDVLAAATLMFGLPNLGTPDAGAIGGAGRWALRGRRSRIEKSKAS